jgi:REP element-mobilizing transposase RayT
MFYRRKLPHLQRDDKPHFITFVTYKRHVLPDWARDIVLASCIHDHEKCYLLHAAVVMPEHVHLILTPLIDQKRQQVCFLPEILDAIKGASSHIINKKSGSRGPIWQDESFEHVLRSSESLEEKIQYVIENPVRRGLVRDAMEYPWLWRWSPVAQCLLSR